MKPETPTSRTRRAVKRGIALFTAVVFFGTIVLGNRTAWAEARAQTRQDEWGTDKDSSGYFSPERVRRREMDVSNTQLGRTLRACGPFSGSLR